MVPLSSFPEKLKYAIFAKFVKDLSHRPDTSISVKKAIFLLALLKKNK